MGLVIVIDVRRRTDQNEIEPIVVAPFLPDIALDVGAQERAALQRHIGEQREPGGAGPGREGILLLVARDVGEAIPRIVGVANRAPQIELGSRCAPAEIDDVASGSGSDDACRVEIVAIVVTEVGIEARRRRPW
jgi:hypothetical protein